MYTRVDRSLAMTTPVKIPQRSVYKAAEVCAIARLPPYVLRSWEAEFPDLGVEQSGSRLRVYRRAHLDTVLRIKELLFVEGLTLGAARRKILKETPAAGGGERQPIEELLGADAQARVEDVKAGLRSILAMLAVSGNGDGVLPIERICDLLAASVSGYFSWKRRGTSRRQLDDMIYLAHIRAYYAMSNVTNCSPRMHAELCEEGVSVGRHRIARLMRENDLRADQKRRFKKTTDSHHGHSVAPNILDQDVTATGPNQKWSVDISKVSTFFETLGGTNIEVVEEDT